MKCTILCLALLAGLVLVESRSTYLEQKLEQALRNLKLLESKSLTAEESCYGGAQTTLTSLIATCSGGYDNNNGIWANYCPYLQDVTLDYVVSEYFENDNCYARDYLACLLAAGNQLDQTPGSIEGLSEECQALLIDEADDSCETDAETKIDLIKDRCDANNNDNMDFWKFYCNKAYYSLDVIVSEYFDNDTCYAANYLGCALTIGEQLDNGVAWENLDAECRDDVLGDGIDFGFDMFNKVIDMCEEVRGDANTIPEGILNDICPTTWDIIDAMEPYSQDEIHERLEEHVWKFRNFLYCVVVTAEIEEKPGAPTEAELAIIQQCIDGPFASEGIEEDLIQLFEDLNSSEARNLKANFFKTPFSRRQFKNNLMKKNHGRRMFKPLNTKRILKPSRVFKPLWTKK